jgi:nucleotide-binding universal stress UspA family protein
MKVKTAPTFTPDSANDYRERADNRNGDPIVAAIDGSRASRAAIETAVHFGAELNAPVVFVHVRRGPAGFFGSPVYQRRLTKKMAHGRRVLDRALATAVRAGVQAESEILEGAPRRRIAEFARDRGAQVVVVGARKWRLGPSVSSGVRRAAERPVIIARAVRQLRGGDQALLDCPSPS